MRISIAVVEKLCRIEIACGKKRKKGKVAVQKD